MGHLESILGQGGTLIGGSTFNHESPKSNCSVSLAPCTAGFHSSVNCFFLVFNSNSKQKHGESPPGGVNVSCGTHLGTANPKCSCVALSSLLLPSPG